jgi:hypothetical protein
MKKLVLALAVIALMASTPAFAAAVKTYQVTGPVLEMTPDAVIVQKGLEKWQIARGAATFPDSVKVGSKVTIEYAMTATKVTVKDGPIMAKAIGK